MGLGQVGALMRPMLLREWDYRDPKGWIVQEKYDGIRAIWDGTRFETREGNVIPCPDWFTKSLPMLALDGELWTRRDGGLNEMLSIFGKGKDADWSDVKFVVFDLPTYLPTEKRLLSLDLLSHRLPSHCRVAASTVCRDESHLEDLLDVVASKNGEGIVLREPGTSYEHKRSGHARKLRLAS